MDDHDEIARRAHDVSRGTIRRAASFAAATGMGSAERQAHLLAYDDVARLRSLAAETDGERPGRAGQDGAPHLALHSHPILLTQGRSAPTPLVSLPVHPRPVLAHQEWGDEWSNTAEPPFAHGRGAILHGSRTWPAGARYPSPMRGSPAKQRTLTLDGLMRLRQVQQTSEPEEEEQVAIDVVRERLGRIRSEREQRQKPGTDRLSSATYETQLGWVTRASVYGVAPSVPASPKRQPSTHAADESKMSAAMASEWLAREMSRTESPIESPEPPTAPGLATDLAAWQTSEATPTRSVLQAGSDVARRLSVSAISIISPARTRRASRESHEQYSE